MGQLQPLHAHVEQAQDERGIEARRAHDGRDAHALGGHDHQLHVAQVEAGVLQVDESGVEPGVPYDLHDLRIGDAADVGSQRHPAFAQDAFYTVLNHVFSIPGSPITTDQRR